MIHPSFESSSHPPAPAASDQSLLDRFQHGSNDAATALYLRYERRLRALAKKQVSPRLARRFDPEDIVQSVFRTFFRRARRGEYEVPEGQELWSLLLVIALNKIRGAVKFHRAAKRDAAATVSGDARHWEASARIAHDEDALTVLRLVIAELVDRLPEAQRRIIELRIRGEDVVAIAAHTGRAKRSVERVLQSFRQTLQAALGD